MQVHSAIRTASLVQEPFIQAADVEAVEAGHHSKSVTHQVLLETHRALLSSIEPLVHHPPLHRRKSPDFLYRHPSLTLWLRKEGTIEPRLLRSSHTMMLLTVEGILSELRGYPGRVRDLIVFDPVKGG
jgi:hypothetical protein